MEHEGAEFSITLQDYLDDVVHQSQVMQTGTDSLATAEATGELAPGARKLKLAS